MQGILWWGGSSPNEFTYGSEFVMNSRFVVGWIRTIGTEAMVGCLFAITSLRINSSAGILFASVTTVQFTGAFSFWCNT
jgi:hypothetical protein